MWRTYGLTMMHFEDSCAMCSLEVAKSRVADMGKAIDREGVNMIKKLMLTMVRVVGPTKWSPGWWGRKL